MGGPARILELIRFSHTLFALPFALTGMILAARGLPQPAVAAWIVAAMVGGRTLAMAFNRLADARFDAANPRTRDRALPAGHLTPGTVVALFAAATALFLVAAWRLNPLTFALAPLAFVILCGYSLTKRFTSLSHLFLGLALSGAPLGAWIAVRGEVSVEPFLLAAGVLFWSAGFDVIYALQDESFDRAAGLRSLPARLGGSKALGVARLFHILAVIFLLLAGQAAGLGWWYRSGVLLVAALLVAEHAIVRPDELSRLELAFFRLNVAIGFIVLAATGLDLAALSR